MFVMWIYIVFLFWFFIKVLSVDMECTIVEEMPQGMHEFRPRYYVFDKILRRLR